MSIPYIEFTIDMLSLPRQAILAEMIGTTNSEMFVGISPRTAVLSKCTVTEYFDYSACRHRSKLILQLDTCDSDETPARDWNEIFN